MDELSRSPFVFLLPGVGDHYVGMGRDLYEKWQAFRQEAVDRARPCSNRIWDSTFVKLFIHQTSVESQGGKKGIDLRKMLGRDGQ